MDDTPRIGIRLHGGLAPRRCVELAVAAEVNGFASVWFAENPLERGALPALAACAAATSRIELGVGVWNPFLRHPAQIAMDASALDELAQGPLPPGVEIHTIAAARDWVVPLATTRMAGASAVTVPLGHSSLVVSEEVYRRVVNALRPPHEQASDETPATD